MPEIIIDQTDAAGYEKALGTLEPKLARPLHFLNAPFYGQWQAAAGKKVVYFSAASGKNLIGCGLAIKLTIPGGYYYLYCPYGPLVTKWSPELVTALKQFFKRSFNKKLLFVRLDASNLSDKLIKPASESVAATAALQPRNEWLIDISGSEEQILAAMKQKGRYHIRLSEKKGAAARIEKCEPSQLDKFYELLVTTGARDKFSILPKRNYQAALEILGENAYLGYVDLDGRPIASAFCLDYDGMTHYVYGSSADEYRQLGIGYLLQWRCIQEAKARGSKSYNFGGVAGGVKGDKLAGVTLFKQRFGGFSVSHPLPHDLAINASGYKLFSLYKKLQKS